MLADTRHPFDVALDLAMDIFQGRSLSEKDYNRACHLGYLIGFGTYEEFSRICYEDARIRGYLCIDPETMKIRAKGHDKTEDGKKRLCFFGLHREDVDPERLRPEQKEMW